LTSRTSTNSTSFNDAIKAANVAAKKVHITSSTRPTIKEDQWGLTPGDAVAGEL
jgi:hypothetical protein